MGIFSRFKPDPVVFTQGAGGFESGIHGSDHAIGPGLEVVIGISTTDKNDTYCPAPANCTRGDILLHFRKDSDKAAGHEVYWEDIDQKATLELLTAVQKKLAALPADPARSEPVWQNNNGSTLFEHRVIQNPSAPPAQWQTSKGSAGRNPIMITLKDHQNVGMTIHVDASSASEMQQKVRAVHDAIMEVVHERTIASGTSHVTGRGATDAARTRA